MAEVKKYYWLKLKKDFFKRHDIMIIESMPNGKDYVLFYLKLLVESLSHEGNLRFSDTIPYDENMLATITNTNIDIVRSAMKIFESLHLVELMDDKTIFMAELQTMIGSETEWAKKKRIYRQKQNELPAPKTNDLIERGQKRTLSDKSKSIEIDIDIEKDIDKSIEDKSSPPRSKVDQFDWKSFQDYWNSNSGLANIRQLTQSRKTAVNGRVKEYGLDTVHKVIDKCKESDFLQGKIKSNRKWVATFDWVFSPKNFIKILEGNYDNKEISKPSWYQDYEKDVKEYENKNKSEMTKEEKNKVFEDAKKIFGK